jgi:hypothetical protein
MEIEDSEEERRNQSLRTIHDLGKYSAVFVPGISPSFIIKSASSPPRVINFKGEAIRNLSSFNTWNCERGFVFIDAKVKILNPSLLSDLTMFGRALCLRQDFHQRASS